MGFFARRIWKRLGGAYVVLGFGTLAGGGAAARRRGHRDVIYPSAPVHATLAQPAAGADALKDLRARTRAAQEIARAGLKSFPGARARVLGKNSTNPAEFCMHY